MNSLWSATVNIPRFEPLRNSAETDVLIIGGGMAGVLCAYFLKEAGVSCLLVEGNRIGSGITKDTTAKITAQHGLIYHKIVNSDGRTKARMYLDANRRAIDEYRRLCADIDCDFEEKDSYIYSLTDRRTIVNEAAALRKIGSDARFVQSISLPFDIAGAVRFPRQAQFHPLKFLAGISKGLNIYERTFVRGLAPHTAFISHGKIRARHIIVATHFPFLNKHGSYYLKMYQHRSYAIALENAPDVGGMFLEEKMNGLSFRNHDGLLIVGGGDHKTGCKGGNWAVLRDFAAHTYPRAAEKYAWATQDCMTLDGIPYIGRYSNTTEGLYVATGFNKWGMTSSMVAAKLLTDLVTGKKNKYETLFSPSRSMIKPQLLVNGFSAVTNLLTPSKRRCPHLGCALKWNPVERSWDCPCHGSRFDEDGILIDNPATGGLSH